MKVCPICKSEYSDKSKFCKNDGSPLEDKDGKKCPHCGALLKGNGKFCSQCGKSTEVIEEKECKCPKCGFVSNEKLKFCPDCGYSFAEDGIEKKSGLSEDFVLIDCGYIDPFYISKYEVTQELYQSVTGENPSGFIGGRRPVDSVSWYDAIRFCNMLSKKEGKVPVYKVDGNSDVNCWKIFTHDEYEGCIDGKIEMDESANGYRLPTLMEWQAAVAGVDEYIYSGSDVIEEVAWYEGNSGERTHNVGQKKPNSYGLYDMSGNVEEWCWNSDEDGRYYVCGGAWDGDEDFCSCGDKYAAEPYVRINSYGLRLVCKKETEISERKNVDLTSEFVLIKNGYMDPFYISKYEVTQELYQSVTDENPSEFIGLRRPVDSVSWYDAIRFCNMLSKKEGKVPVYKVDGKSDVDGWKISTHKEEIGSSGYVREYKGCIDGKIEMDKSANGYRLPTLTEWQAAAAGVDEYIYSGSDVIEEVAWYEGNSGEKTHNVGQKKPNSYGLYDMSGNVGELCWDSDEGGRYYVCGGCFDDDEDSCSCGDKYAAKPYVRINSYGLRLVCKKETEISERKNVDLTSDFVLIKTGNMDPFYISKYEVTQELYQSVTGENPSEFIGLRRPVDHVSWYDAIRFCNMLSRREGKVPVYKVDGNPDVNCWKISTNDEYKGCIDGKIEMDKSANGYRLPTLTEWQTAATGGRRYIYSGSDAIEEVAWYEGNSGEKTHNVGQMKPNSYGLYDMSGNVDEWCWDSDYYGNRYIYGGSFDDDADDCAIFDIYDDDDDDDDDDFCTNGCFGKPCIKISSIGFRVVCNGSGKFCSECDKSTVEKKRWKCPKCGFESDEKLKSCPDCGYSFAEGEEIKKVGLSSDFVLIDGGAMKPFYISKYEVTQELYQSITGANPSNCKGKQRPVENVSWFDAIRFCNMLSKKEGKTPVYSVDGNTDVNDWDYTPHEDDYIGGELEMDIAADGYRLPTKDEWKFAAAGGEDYTYAGSDDIDEVAWYLGNSGDATHNVGQKKSNGYGLYDMSGNVDEWCWYSDDDDDYYRCGGSWGSDDDACKIDYESCDIPNLGDDYLGFRVACNK